MVKIYEVIAIENSMPLFFLKHIERLKSSITQFKQYSSKELIDVVVTLIKPIIKKSDGQNIKITYCSEKDSFTAEEKKPRKPSIDEYKYGAKTEIFRGERVNPLIKQENISFREITEKICIKHNCYDLLLMNNRGYITEGSRSNFLLIDRKNNIVTSPIGDALNGITRSVIFDICKSEGFPILERDITEESLKSSQSLIITGTSPEILPIISCGSNNFSVDNKIIETLKNKFEKRKELDKKVAKELFNL